MDVICHAFAFDWQPQVNSQGESHEFLEYFPCLAVLGQLPWIVWKRFHCHCKDPRFMLFQVIYPFGKDVLYRFSCVAH